MSSYVVCLYTKAWMTSSEYICCVYFPTLIQMGQTQDKQDRPTPILL